MDQDCDSCLDFNAAAGLGLFFPHYAQKPLLGVFRCSQRKKVEIPLKKHLICREMYISRQILPKSPPLFPIGSHIKRISGRNRRKMNPFSMGRNLPPPHYGEDIRPEARVPLFRKLKTDAAVNIGHPAGFLLRSKSN